MSTLVPEGDGHIGIHDAEGRHVGDICQGTNRRYRVFVRPYGHRRWQAVGKPSRSKRAALRRLVQAMEGSSYYKRGIVTMHADYYDPRPIYELVGWS